MNLKTFGDRKFSYSAPDVWNAGSAPISLSFLNAVQKCLHSLVGNELFGILQPLSHGRDVSSLSLLYHLEIWHRGSMDEYLKISF